MKNLLISCFMVLVPVAGMAQDEVPTEKHSVATNSFWNNWFVQGGVQWNAWYGNYEDGMGFSKSPFKKFRSNPGFAVGIGKWFTPSLGLRTKFQGIWGKAVFDEDNRGNGNKYWILNEHVMFNLSNMFCGYNPSRTWSLIPFAGGGIGRSMSHDRYAMGISLGVLNQFRLNDKVALNLEIGWNRYESDLCNMSAGYGTGIMSHPNNVYAEVGVTYNIGRPGWSKTPDVESIKSLSQAQIDALNAQLADEQAENARLQGELGDSVEIDSAVVDSPFVEDIPADIKIVSVFFDINKSTWASGRDEINVKTAADFAKELGLPLVVTGYADSATGSKETNERLSRERAETVAKALERFGVPKDNIRIEAKGGVDEYPNPSYNRCVTIKVGE